MTLGKEDIKTLLLIAIVVLLVLTWKCGSDDELKAKISEREQKIKSLDEKIKDLEAGLSYERAAKDSAIAEGKRKDEELKKRISTTIIRYEKVRDNIISFSKDSLRIAGERAAREQ